MIRFLFCLFFTAGIFCSNSHAAVQPVFDPAPANPQVKKMMDHSVKDLEKLMGKKLTFREKLAWNVARIKSKYFTWEEGEPTPKQLKQGNTAATLGGIGIGLLLLALFAVNIGAFVLLSLPLGIAALILGIKSSKGNGNTMGLIGLITGATITFFWLLAAIALAVFLSSWGW